MPEQDAATPGQAAKHNHMTRDVKAEGQCPACDLTHARHREATPGQAAYEAHAAMVVPRPWRWSQLDDKLRAAWEAAAEAASRATTAKLAAETARYKAERNDALDDVLFERKQVIALREVLTQVFNCVAARDWALFDDDQMAEWRESAGLAEDGQP